MIDTHPISFDGLTPSPAWAFAEYQRIRKTLPAGLPPEETPCTRELESLEPLLDHFQVFVFDAFGVLNAGPRAFPSAISRIRQLQERGKTVRILSTAATASHSALVAKYRGMGFDIGHDQLISSRSVLEQSLSRQLRKGRFGVLSPASSAPDTLGVDWLPVRPGIQTGDLDRLDGFIFLSSEGWNEEVQEALAKSLARHPRPLLVANPDLVAPRGDCLTLEPGYFAHLLMGQSAIEPEFFGKPYRPAFDSVLETLKGVDPVDVLMVGDTLHTDILGGQAAGMKTMLITAEGALQGMNIPDCISQSGIVPDFIAPMI